MGWVAPVVAGGMQVAGGIMSAMADAPTAGGRPSELPPELEPAVLDQYLKYLNQADQEISDGKELIPKLETRLDEMDAAAKAGTPSAEQIQKINSIEAEISQRFGKETLADVKAGLITDQVKEQTLALQNQIKSELEAQGKQVDDKLAMEISQSIRDRMSGNNLQNQSLNEVGQQLLDEIRRTGDPVPDRDPRVENELKAQEDAARSRLRAQFGPDYENTTQGRRALRDFFQGATETRFTVAQNLKKAAAEAGVAKATRLSTLSQTAAGLAQEADRGILSSVEAVKGTQDILQGRITRLSSLGQTIGGAADNAVKAAEPERQRMLLEAEKAKVALASTQQTRAGFQAGIQQQQDILKLRDLPFQMRQQLLAANMSKIAAAERIGQFKWSYDTTEALKFGDIAGFKDRTTTFGGPAANRNQPGMQAAQQQANIVRDVLAKNPGSRIEGGWVIDRQGNRIQIV